SAAPSTGTRSSPRATRRSAWSSAGAPETPAAPCPSRAIDPAESGPRHGARCPCRATWPTPNAGAPEAHGRVEPVARDLAHAGRWHTRGPSRAEPVARDLAPAGRWHTRGLSRAEPVARDLTIARVDVDPDVPAPQRLRCDQGRAAAAEWV